MTVGATKLSWCVVRLGNDLNWWVDEISDPMHWDLDGLSILDPKQRAYVLELIDGLKDYGLDVELLQNAFFRFRIDKKLPDGRVKLVRTEESLLEADEPIFSLPDVVDEDRGPYADFIDHITRLRVKMLNELIEFEQKLSVEEIEEDLRERYQQEFFEGNAIHVFKELVDILEYIPDGYTLDAEEEERPNKDEEYDKLEVEDVEGENEWLEEDETMRWEDDDIASEGNDEEIENPEKELEASPKKRKSK